MTEYPVHGRLHSFLVVKRKCMLSGNSQLWNGWVQRNSEGRVAEVSTSCQNRHVWVLELIKEY